MADKAVTKGGYVLTGVRDVEKRIQSELESVTLTAQGFITRQAGSGGKIPPNRISILQAQIGQAVESFFVGPNGKPFKRDGVSANAPFPELLNQVYANVTAEAVRAQYIWLKRNTPDDVFAFLKSGTRPFPVTESREQYLEKLRRWVDEQAGEGVTLSHIVTSETISADDLRIFKANPFEGQTSTWVGMHYWKDENGYELSDRIWQNSQRTRKKLEQLLEYEIRNGTGALRLSRLLEQFLLPGRANIRTNKPYGTNAAFDAMRLARSEIARAANMAAHIAAQLNPYVDRADIARSRTGDPTCKVCPQHATINIAQTRVRPPYNIQDAPVPYWHPHCKCRLQPLVAQSPGDITNWLQQYLNGTNPTRPVVNPANPVDLLMPLLGPIIIGLVGNELLEP